MPPFLSSPFSKPRLPSLVEQYSQSTNSGYPFPPFASTYGLAPLTQQPSSGSSSSSPRAGSPSPTPLTPSMSNSSSAYAGQEVRRKTPSSWDPHDDLLLRHLKEQLKLGWKEIAAYFPNRTTNACQFRWRRLVSGTLRSPVVLTPGTAAVAVPPTPPALSPSNSASYDSQRSSSISSTHSAPGMTNSYFVPQPMASQQVHHHHHHQPVHNFAPLAAAAPPTPASEARSFSLPAAQVWTRDQDELLLSRKDLSPEELSLLLGHSEADITQRIAKLTAQQPAPATPVSSADEDNVLIVDAEEASPAGDDSVPRIMRARAGSHPRPQLPRKASISHFDGLRLPLPVLQRPNSDTKVPYRGESVAL